MQLPRGKGKVLVQQPVALEGPVRIGNQGLLAVMAFGAQRIGLEHIPDLARVLRMVDHDGQRLGVDELLQVGGNDIACMDVDPQLVQRQRHALRLIQRGQLQPQVAPGLAQLRHTRLR
jgi:hypothetical protein